MCLVFFIYKKHIRRQRIISDRYLWLAMFKKYNIVQTIMCYNIIILCFIQGGYARILNTTFWIIIWYKEPYWIRFFLFYEKMVKPKKFLSKKETKLYDQYNLHVVLNAFWKEMPFNSKKSLFIACLRYSNPKNALIRIVK